MRRLLLGATAASAMLVGVVTPAASAAPASACVVSDVLVNSCRPWLGASVGKYPGVATDLRAQVEAHEQRIGRPLDIVHSYHPVGSLPLDADELYFVNRPDTHVFLNWKPANVWAAAAGGDAAVNAQIDQAADRFNAVRSHKVFLTIFHEPENDVSSGNCTANAAGAGAGSPTDYRNMWRNVHDRFAARGVTNVVWVMDYMNYSPRNCLVDELYPGNDLVDWVMFNGYGGGRPDFAGNVNRFYQLLTAQSNTAHNYLSKPWGIVEWNFQNATEAEGMTYYDEAKSSLDADQFPKLKAYMIFDNVGPDGNENRVAYAQGGVWDPRKQDHYTAFATDPRLVGDSVQQPGPPVTTPPVTTPPVTSPPVTSPPVTTPPEVTPPVTTPPEVTPPEVTPPVTTPPEVTPPEVTPPVVTPPGTEPPDSDEPDSDEPDGDEPDGDGQDSVGPDHEGPHGDGADATPSWREAPGPALSGDVSVTSVSPTGIALSWGPSAAEGTVTEYRVYRNGTLVTTLPAPTCYRDTGLSPTTTYSYRVLAVTTGGVSETVSPSATTVTTTRAEDRPVR